MLHCDSPFFARQKKRIFLFFLWGDLVQNCPQNPAPGGCLFSTRKSRSEVPEREDFGEEDCLGKGGADRGKKRKKGCTKKGGVTLRVKKPCVRQALVFFQPLTLRLASA